MLGHSAIAANAQGAAPLKEARREALRLVVKSISNEAVGVSVFELEAPDRSELPGFSAGSHVDIFLPGSRARQYSLCGPVGDRSRYRVAVLRDPHGRGGSRHMHDVVKVGDVLETSHPRNAFGLDEDAPFSLLIAGGIGITPILSMALRLHDLGRDFEVHYCARNRASMAFHDLLSRSAFRSKVRFYFSGGPGGGRLDAAQLLSAPKPGAQLYVCGPKRLMDAVLDQAQGRWPASSVHREWFGGGGAQAETEERPFAVTIASTQQTFMVDPSKTVVEVLRAHGIEIPVSCEQGLCGTCLTRVLEGIPDHRDVYLTENERNANDRMMPCCSRGRSDLVLDL